MTDGNTIMGALAEAVTEAVNAVKAGDLCPLRQQHIKHHPLKSSLHLLTVEVLHHLILVRLAAYHDRFVQSAREIAEQRLLGGIVRDLVHYPLILTDLVADRVGVVDQIQVGQTVGNLTFGFLADRFGHKLSLELGALVSLFAFLLAWLSPAPHWYYGVFALLGIAIGAMIVSGILVIMEFCEPQRRPTYAGMANSSMGLVSLAAPLIGAWLAKMSYSWLFALSAIVYLLAFIALHWWVKEPRSA